jgi:hypothetical protein
MGSLPTFDQALALRLRELRDLWGLSLEDVAASARSIGLDWSRGTVWAIEKVERDSSGSGSGSRRLAMAELLILPAILQRAGAAQGVQRDVSLDDVMPRVDHVRIGTLRLPGEALRGVLRGSPIDTFALEDPELRSQQPERSAERGALESLVRAQIPQAATEVLAWARLPVERSVARRLDVAPELAAMAGYRRWGASLTSHRDEIASQHSKPTSSDVEARRQLTAVRGHATREILNDDDFLEAVRGLSDMMKRSMGPGDLAQPDQPCRWCRGAGLMLCPGSRDRPGSLDRSVEDIRNALVARYCEDEELRLRIDAEALAGPESSHHAAGERCLWCDRVGPDAGHFRCPRCLGSSVDPEACPPGGATLDPELSPGDRSRVAGRVLRALIDTYLDDDRFQRSIRERIDANPERHEGPPDLSRG